MQEEFQGYRQILKNYTDLDFQFFMFQVASGNVPGHSFVNKFGGNDDVDAGDTPVDIWSFGGAYTFSTTADIDTVSSSSASDTTNVVIEGLDTNWEHVTQEVTLTGQTAVELTTPLIRCYRMYNAGSVNFDGDIYTSVAGTLTAGVPVDADVRAMITKGDEQTMMAIYTVPAGKTAFLVDSYSTLGRTRSSIATMEMRVRGFGGVFKLKNRITLGSDGNSSFQKENALFAAVPEKTDIKMQCSYVSINSVEITAGFDILLVDNEFTDLD